MDISSTFQKQGFIQGIPVLSESQALKLRRHIENAEQQYQKEIQEKRQDSAPWSNPNHTIQRIFQSLARHPVILQHASQAIGPDILVRNGDVFIKSPQKKTEICWHVDTPFSWPESKGMINCWIGLNPTSPFHGGLQYIPKSHQHIFEQEPPDKYSLSLTSKQVKELNLKSAVSNIMPTGHMAIHSFRTVHNSLVNKSEIRRIGLVIRFISAQTTPEVAETGQAFLAQGNPRLWKNKLRPYFPISWNTN